MSEILDWDILRATVEAMDQRLTLAELYVQEDQVWRLCVHVRGAAQPRVWLSEDVTPHLGLSLEEFTHRYLAPLVSRMQWGLRNAWGMFHGHGEPTV